MDFIEPIARNEAILQNMLGAENELLPPMSRIEVLLTALLEEWQGMSGDLLPRVDSSDNGDVLGVVEGQWDKMIAPSYDVDTELSPTSQHPVENRAIYSGIEKAITNAISGITRFEYYLCDSDEYDHQTGIPTVQDADTNHIYLVPTSGDNLNMYAYIDSSFVFLGTTEMDLSGYVTTSELTDALEDKADASDLADCVTESELTTALSDKADANHDHDSRYYTETEVDTKLSNKANASHTHAYSEITGTPTIPVVPSNLVTGSTSSYTIVVQNSAPSSALNNQITIVVPA